MNRVLCVAAAATAVLLLWSAPGVSIIRRHDRDDARYIELGAKFPVVTSVHPGAAGTLIAPQWILTAGHVGDGLGRRSALRPMMFTGKEYELERIYVHPCLEWGSPVHDLALLKLRRPVEGVTPVPIYRGADEAGRLATLVGRGFAGTGAAGAVPQEQWDKQWRAGTNRIDRADGFVVEMAFDAPPGGTELEGLGGPGDSGGPVFVEADGQLYLAAISSTLSHKGGGPSGVYGDRERDARVSADAEWIDAVINDRIYEPQCHSLPDFLLWGLGGMLLGAALGIGVWKLVLRLRRHRNPFLPAGDSRA